MDHPQVVLASASPRRRDLLAQVGLPFSVQPSTVHEDRVMPAGPGHGALVEAVAVAKARDVAAGLDDPRGRLVIGADTVVVLDDEVLGKPRDTGEAVAMLGRLTGRTHEVFTGLAVVDPMDGRTQVGHERTLVTMRKVPGDWLEAYVDTGEPMDKAGAYAVQGLGSILVERVEGCYFNIVGLPLARLAVMLEEWNVEFASLWRAAGSGRPVSRRG